MKKACALLTVIVTSREYLELLLRIDNAAPMAS
jgi:hypothetical protein